MKVEILGYCESDGGAIAGDDGARYRFGRADWRSAAEPTPGTRVDFEGQEGQALHIYPLVVQSQPTPPAQPAAPSQPTVAPVTTPAAPTRPPARTVPLWRTPLFMAGATLVLFVYIFLIPPTLFHPMSGSLKPLLLIGLSIAAIIWRSKRSFDRTNQYGVESFRGFGHVIGSGALDLVAGLGAIVGLIVGGFALVL